MLSAKATFLTRVQSGSHVNLRGGGHACTSCIVNASMGLKRAFLCSLAKQHATAHVNVVGVSPNHK